MRNYKTCLRGPYCRNPRQGNLTEADYGEAEKGLGLAVNCRDCVDHSERAKSIKNKQNLLFGCMTKIEVFNSRFDVLACQKFLTRPIV